MILTASPKLPISALAAAKVSKLEASVFAFAAFWAASRALAPLRYLLSGQVASSHARLL